MLIKIGDGLEQPQRGWAMFAIILGILLSGLDAAIANIALPALSRDFAVDPAATVWVVNAYQLAMTVSILPFSALGESLGYRRVYWLGLLAFTISSLACVMAPSLPVLVAARALQGVSGAALAGVSQALVRCIYPKRMLGSGMSWYTLVVGITYGLGPIVGSAILSVANWPWLFAINLPLGLFALIAAWKSLPDVATQPRRFDWSGAALNAVVIIVLIMGLDTVSDPGSAYLAAAEIGVALVLGFFLVRQQSKREAALLPIDLFRIPIFALSCLTSICSYAAQTIGILALPFYLLNALGRSQLEAGLLIAAWPLSVAMIARLSGKMADRFSAGVLAGAGLFVMAIGLATLALIPTDASAANLVWRIVLCGFGFGFFQTPNNRAIMTAGPVQRSGAANGAMASARMLGHTTGAALTAVVFALAAPHGPITGFVVASLIALVGACVSLLRLTQSPRSMTPMPG